MGSTKSWGQRYRGVNKIMGSTIPWGQRYRRVNENVDGVGVGLARSVIGPSVFVFEEFLHTAVDTFLFVVISDAHRSTTLFLEGKEREWRRGLGSWYGLTPTANPMHALFG